MTWLLSPLLGLPRYLWGVMAVVAVVGGFIAWDHFDDKAAVEADRAVSNAQAQSDARKADERAHAASQGTTDTVSAENRAAAEAAAKSDDPLKSGLDELRNHQR